MPRRWLGLLVVLGLLSAPTVQAAPLWLGPWLVDPQPPPGLAVSRPATGVPGASLRVAPSAKGPPVGLVRATFEFVDAEFDGGSALVELAAAPTAVHAQVKVDGQVVAVLSKSGTHPVLLPAGRRVMLELQALDATATGWQVTLHGLVVTKAGWTLTYSHDMAGLRAVVVAPDAVVLRVDPDWAELGWPLAGTVAASRTLAGRTLTAEVTQTLPPGTLQSLLSVDDVPFLVPQPGPLTLKLADGAKLALLLHAKAEVPGQAHWQVGLRHLRLDDAALAVATPGTTTPTAADPVAGGRRPGGCVARPAGSSLNSGANAVVPQLVVALAGLAVACWRRPRGRGARR